MKVKIYFETGPLDPLHEIDYKLCDTLYVISCRSGYRAMINEAGCAIKNQRNIYTNEVSLIGASELWGKIFMHEIWLKNPIDQSWYRMNPHLIERLGKPEDIERYIRKYICVDKGVV